MAEELEFEGKVVDIDKRESEKGKTYFYLLVEELGTGEETSFGAWEKEIFPVLEKTVIGDQVKGTYKQSGDFRNIKTIEVVGGDQRRLVQQQLPVQAPMAVPIPVQMPVPVIPIEAVRLQALNFAVQIVLKGMKPEEGVYPTGHAKAIANEFVSYVLKGE